LIIESSCACVDFSKAENLVYSISPSVYTGYGLAGFDEVDDEEEEGLDEEGLEVEGLEEDAAGFEETAGCPSEDSSAD